MKLRLFLWISVLSIILLYSCKEKLSCNFYIDGDKIYSNTDSSLQWQLYTGKSVSYYKFEIEEKKIPSGFKLPEYEELKTLVDGIIGCDEVELPKYFPESIKLLSVTDTINYEGQELFKGFELMKIDEEYVFKDVAIDKGEVVTILFKKQ
jgi:hypothetical protein